MLKFETSAVLPCSAAALRQFLGCPANLPEISDPDIELQILSAPETVQAGTRIEFRIMSFGLRHRMAHEYRQVTETEIFEVLVDGPLPAWQHRQQLQALGPQQCQLTDTVEFQLPGGMLRFILTEERIRESLTTGMQYRYQTLQQMAESGAIG
jgi:ligand-binding SRPBCC domain-containing protein